MKIGALGLMVISLNAPAVTPVSRLAVGDTLPPLRGEYLTRRPALLPQDASGRVTLLLLGFTYDSRFAVEAWTTEFRHQFDKNPKVTFYEIPMIGGLARLGKWFIDSGMRKGTPQADQGNVITVYGGTEAWKQRVGFSDPKAACLILIDQRGNVAWQYAGAFAPEPFNALAAVAAKLAGE